MSLVIWYNEFELHITASVSGAIFRFITNKCTCLVIRKRVCLWALNVVQSTFDMSGWVEDELAFNTATTMVEQRWNNEQLTHWYRYKMTAILQTIFADTFSCMKIVVSCSKFQWNMFLRVQWTICQFWLSLLSDAKQVTRQWWPNLLTHTPHYTLIISEYFQKRLRYFVNDILIYICIYI